MPSELRWNRLVISASSEQEFLQAVSDYFPQLLQLPYEDVEVDITGSQEITEDAFRSIAIKLIGGEATEKKMLIRIPPTVDRYFRHANLYRMVEIEVVQPIEDEEQLSPDAVKANIRNSRYDHKATARVKDAAMPKGAGTKKPKPSSGMEARPPESATSGVGFLLDVENGARYEIKGKLVIGREAPSDLVFQIPTISKRHFLIRSHGNGFAIEDLRSTNGTYLNGLPVHEPVTLRDGDEIVVAITLKHPKGARIFQFSTKR